MSFALRLTGTPATADAAADASGPWLWAGDAAQAAGLNRGQVNRRCLEEWSHDGLARQARHPDTGQTQWQVRADAHPAFAAKPAAPTDPDAGGVDVWVLTDAQRGEVYRWAAVCREWDEARRGVRGSGEMEETLRLFLRVAEHRHGVAITRPTLYRRHAAWLVDGLAAFVDRRWETAAAALGEAGPTGGDGRHAAYYEALERIWLDPRERSKKLAHKYAARVAADAGGEAPSYRTALLRLAKLRKADVVLHREGPDAYKRKAEAFVERDYSTLDVDEEWVGDQHQLDVAALHEGKIVRPWLTAWMDMRSRKLVGWTLTPHGGNSDTILAAFKAGVLAEGQGAPGRVYIDNGKDYDAYVFHGRTKWQRQRQRRQVDARHFDAGGVFGALGVGVTHAWAYHGQSKPIERFFGRLEDQWGKLWPTYVGRSPAHKPHNLAARLKRGEAPTLGELRDGLADWLDGQYHAEPHLGHGMDGRSPDQVYRQCRAGEPRRCDRRHLEFLLMARTPPRKVGRNGVTFQGSTYGKSEPALMRMLGAEVTLAYDDDLSRVLVCTVAGQLVCEAAANRRTPANADRQTVRQAISEKKADKRLKREYVAKRHRMAEDLPQHVARIAAEKRAAETASTTPRRPVDGPSKSGAMDGLRAAFGPAIADAARPEPSPEAAEPPRRLRLADAVRAASAADDQPDADSPQPDATAARRAMGRLLGGGRAG